MNKVSVQESIKSTHSRDLAIQTAKSINGLVSWSIWGIPPNKGVTLFKLGNVPRVPFHLYFSTEEAEELLSIVKELKAASDVVEKLGIEVDEEV